MAQADSDNALTIKNILNQFGEISDLRENKDKSTIFFSKNVSQDQKNTICGIFEFSLSNNLDIYLGYLLHSNSRNASYQLIIEKLNAKLNGWKTKFLNLIGRIVFIKSVL